MTRCEIADSVLLRAARLPGRAEPADVLLRDGRIAAIAERVGDHGAREVVDADGRWLVPGWVDIQVNDIEWLASGPCSAAEHAARLREVCAWQAARGVTGVCLATLAAPVDDVVAYLHGVADVRREPRAAEDSVLLGALVEGTFMNPEFCGAHNPRWVLPPSLDVLERLLATGAVRLLNVAPEMAGESLAVIRRATEAGVVVGVGHAKPHAECVREAVEAGLRYVIHLGNGPTGSSLKGFHDGGLLEEALRNDAIVITVIVDGIHVHRELVRDWIERKGVERTIAVSDAGFAMQVPAGEFEVFGIRGRASADRGYLEVVASESTPVNPRSSDVARLFGAAIGMREVFENLVNLLTVDVRGVWHRDHRAVALSAALAQASCLCAANPARLLGLADRGELAPGRRADVLLLDVRGGAGAYGVGLERVFLGRPD